MLNLSSFFQLMSLAGIGIFVGLLLAVLFPKFFCREEILRHAVVEKKDGSYEALT